MITDFTYSIFLSPPNLRDLIESLNNFKNYLTISSARKEEIALVVETKQSLSNVLFYTGEEDNRIEVFINRFDFSAIDQALVYTKRLLREKDKSAINLGKIKRLQKLENSLYEILD